MGNLIFGTTVIQGRTFDDIKIQTSKAGVPRPIIFGTARPIVGNIIATTAPRIVVTRDEQEGGKGGPSVEVENEEVFRTYAIRICEGPVTGVPRVWRNNELVYDRDSTDPTQIENNTAFLEKAEFFLGAFDQMPSAVMQSAFGMNNVHGYRGTCYMVVDDENLTATGGAIPQYAFEVERCEGFALTSRPYAIESVDSIVLLPDVRKADNRIASESINVKPSVESIFLETVIGFINYGMDSENIDIEPSVTHFQIEVIPVPGSLHYDSGFEPIDISANVESIFLETVIGLINYGMDSENIDIEPSVSSINLESVL